MTLETFKHSTSIVCDKTVYDQVFPKLFKFIEMFNRYNRFNQYSLYDYLDLFNLQINYWYQQLSEK